MVRVRLTRELDHMLAQKIPQMGKQDFFISYNRKDKAWVEWIAHQLEEAGYTTAIQVWDFRPGRNFVQKMHHAAKDTEWTIAVLSPNYLDAEYT